MKKLFLSSVTLLSVLFCFGQKFPCKGDYKQITEAKTDNYEVMYSVSGDLNADTYSDLIVIFKKNNEAETSDFPDKPEYRPMFIYSGQKNGKYKLAARNDKAVLCYDAGGSIGDPFNEIEIGKQNFTMSFTGGSGWRWERSIKFAFNAKDKNWVLESESENNFHSAEPENIETNVKTDFGGKIYFKDFDVYKDE